MRPESLPDWALLLSEVRNSYRHDVAVWKTTSLDLPGGLADAIPGRVANDGIFMELVGSGQ